MGDILCPKTEEVPKGLFDESNRAGVDPEGILPSNTIVAAVAFPALDLGAASVDVADNASTVS